MERDSLINENEQIDDLGRELRIIQKKQGFKYGTDSVLLAKYVLMSRDILPVKCPDRNIRCADFGTGTGILPLLLSRDKAFTDISGLELQTEYAEMARRSVALNGLSRRIRIIEGDIKEAASVLESQGVKYRNLSIDSSSAAGKYASEIMAFPTTILVDRNGNIVGEPMLGGIDNKDNYDALMKQIQSVIDADSTNK